MLYVAQLYQVLDKSHNIKLCLGRKSLRFHASLLRCKSITTVVSTMMLMGLGVKLAGIIGVATKRDLPMAYKTCPRLIGRVDAR